MREVIEMFYKKLGESNSIKFHTKGNWKVYIKAIEKKC